ncbi:MAG TPA: hypothetical protein VM370_06835 [Candidatus Thermoplasmatota archaeon]|nr:hypothetical protein [Candidatus Thermoplasmatota archaeon]
MARWWILALALALAAPSAFALGLALPAPPSSPHPSPPASAAADADYRLAFDCPDAVPGTGVPAGCPSYVLDREDVMGSPRLVLDPNDPSRAAFGALHGGRGVHPVPGAEPPTGRSRDDAVHQPHTIFRTSDGGVGWTDMPYHAPDALRVEGREIYGDDHALALDSSGRLHIAALYSYRDGSGPLATGAPFQSAVALWKAHDIARDVDYHANLKVLAPASDPAARIDSLDLVHVAASDVVAVVWREVPPTGEPQVTLFWSKGSDGALWNAAKVGIAGCAAITNPVALDASIVLGCATDEAGPWTVYGIDTASWTAAPLGDAPLTTQNALLLERSAGFLVLVGSGLTEASTPTVQVAYGERGARWSSAEEIAPQLTRGDPASVMVDARVTAAVYSPLSGNLHLIYLERYDLGQGGQEGAGRPEFYKTLASVQAEGTFQGKIDLGIGTVNRAAFSPTLTGAGGDVYGDLHDGLAVWTDPRTGAAREFAAFGDYGFVRYAEIVEENFLSPIAPLSANVPPIPAASAGSVPLLVGVPAGILAGSMVARTLWARKAAAAEAPSE